AHLGEHPLPHLGGGLDGEGDGDHLFRLLHYRKDLQEAAHQELGLARASGRLDDERAPRVEGGVACCLVGDRRGAHWSSVWKPMARFGGSGGSSNAWSLR